MLNARPLAELCNILPITGILRVALLITTTEQETVANTGNARCAVDVHDKSTSTAASWSVFVSSLLNWRDRPEREKTDSWPHYWMAVNNDVFTVITTANAAAERLGLRRWIREWEVAAVSAV